MIKGIFREYKINASSYCYIFHTLGEASLNCIGVGSSFVFNFNSERLCD
jgi:hypothetical protein